MRDKNLNLNTSGDLPESADHMQGFGASKADMKRGFVEAQEATPDYPFNFAETGFLSRPHGWER